MRRRVLAVVGLVALLALAGCSFGSQEVTEDSLSGNATYTWDADVDVFINVSNSQYRAVYHLENDSFLRVYSADPLGGTTPRDVRAVRFRFPNGTVVTANHTGVSATRNSDRLNISVPQAGGKLAFTSNQRGKEFGTPVFLSGSHRVLLPPNARVGIPLMSKIDPGGYSRSWGDDRIVLEWENIGGGTIHARWFLQRDLYLFGGLLAITLVVGGGGTGYYLWQIRRLRRRREEIGLDVDTEDDDLGGDGPPPGMG